MFNNDDMPPGSINQKTIIARKSYISNLLKKIEPDIQITNENIDYVIQQQMEKRNITPTFNPTDTIPNQFDQLSVLLKQLQQEKLQEKKGGKKQKSKRYRKSRKQRKTKTKRRLRRSYKYK